MHCAKLSVGVQVAYDVNRRRSSTFPALPVMIWLVKQDISLVILSNRSAITLSLGHMPVAAVRRRVEVRMKWTLRSVNFAEVLTALTELACGDAAEAVHIPSSASISSADRPGDLTFLPPEALDSSAAVVAEARPPRSNSIPFRISSIVIVLSAIFRRRSASN